MTGGWMSDLISRKAARHALCKAVHKGENIPCENQTASCLWSKTRVCDYVREIDALPSVQPDLTKLSQELWAKTCLITDNEGLQHQVIHATDIRMVIEEVTGWMI